MECRPGCAACCIRITISSPLPGLPEGKPAGMVCPHLNTAGRCRLWGGPHYPEVCAAFQAGEEFCGLTNEEAHRNLAALEEATKPLPRG